jgi:hypothetical protein
VLTNETMGAFCLGVVWLNTLLIVAHVWQAQRALARERDAVGRVVSGTVVSAEEGGSLASLVISQVGRAITTGGPDRILFTEASRTASVHAGAIEIEGRPTRVAPAVGARAWALGGTGVRSDADFDVAYRAASTNRGLASELRFEVGAPGARVWVAGDDAGDELVARLVSDRDPHAVLASGRRRAFGFIALALGVLAGITALALVRPWFSGLSTLGGALAVAYFLAVQPLAVALREAIAVPEQRRVGGQWTRP